MNEHQTILEKILNKARYYFDPNKEFKRLPDNSQLQINYQLQIIRKTQEEGEKDLVRLANECNTEGAWFFVPETNDWYGIAIRHEEVLEGEDIYLQVEIREGTFKISSGKTLFYYHTHPKYFIAVQAKANEKCLGVVLPELVNKNFTINSLATIGASAFVCLPSIEDIKKYLIFHNNFVKFEGAFKGKIASPFGITTVSVTSDSEHVFDVYHEQLSPIGLTNILFENQVLRTEESGPKRIILNVPNLFQQINKNLEGKIELSHTPLAGMKGDIIFYLEKK